MINAHRQGETGYRMLLWCSGIFYDVVQGISAGLALGQQGGSEVDLQLLLVFVAVLQCLGQGGDDFFAFNKG